MKLHAHNADPFKILERLAKFAYVIGIFKDFGIVLYSISKKYNGPDFNPSKSC